MTLVQVLALALSLPVAQAAPGGVQEAAGGPQEAPPHAERVERRLQAMGTWFEVDLRAPDRLQGLRASERALRALQAVEARLSTWTEDSPLARLNRAPVGEAFVPGPELAEDLRRAWRIQEETGGAFDPGVGPLVEAWGLRSGGRRPSGEELEAARDASGLRRFSLSADGVRRLHPGAALEEGGFGKGRGLEAALAALSEAGIRQARLDLGGQLAFLGEAPETHALAHPDDRARGVLALTLEGGSLATSGNGVRGITVDGERLGHLLDPRTGRPAPDFGSLSVWSPDPFEADALSTGLYVLGPEAALAWAEERPHLKVVALVRRPGGLEAWITKNWRGAVAPLEEGLVLRTPGAGGQVTHHEARQETEAR